MLIGLTGRPQAGKNTVAAILSRRLWHAIAFADALRIEVAHAWGCDIRTFTVTAPGAKERVDPRLAARYPADTAWLRYVATQGWSLYDPRSPRWVLQTWGEWRCGQRPDYWTRQVADWITTQRRRGHDALVITDVRKPLEAQMLAQAGGHLVRVHRPGLPPLPATLAAHVSEQHHQLHAAAEIHNDGDLGHLEAEVCRVIHQLLDAGAAPQPDHEPDHR